MNCEIAVLIPCYNEELTIEKVLGDIMRYAPEASIYVFDNNSTDRTSVIAERCGARVIREPRQGKGFVVQSMFKTVDADIYIMVDGDDTYDLSKVHEMISMVRNNEADIVVGSRLESCSSKSFRPLHSVGNRLVRTLVNKLFRADLKDIMSGLRVMSRAFVKNINITSTGFEIETEMSIKALKYKYIIKELSIHYRERPAGSTSKLRTIRDGFLVIGTIFMIFRDYKPLAFFLTISLVFLLISLATGSVVIEEFVRTRYIEHVPLAIFAAGSMILSMIFFVAGVIVDSVNRRFDEIYNFIRKKD